ncbi:NACHT, LRR and PYD domains-containing protein 3-like isoform X2 [Parambassis ranga]|nr:NACHT, LRR and PYD domains-containing protein 3-like isoform X2 [Parambassis ranga]
MAAPFELLGILEDLADSEFKKFKWYLQQAEVLDGFAAISKSQLENADRMDTVDEIIDTHNKNAVEVIMKTLKLIQKNDLVQRLSNLNSMSQESLSDCQHKLKSNLQKRFHDLFEQATESGKQMQKNETYTELCVTKEVPEGQSATCSNQTINIEDVLVPKPDQAGALRTLMTKGGSGTGKTVLTRKFVLDWAEDKLRNDIQFVFPFTFRELNFLKERQCSWMDLLHQFFAETKEVRSFDKLQIVFILDGLDECRLPLDFHNNEILSDVTELSSVDALLTNLIMGKLFPTASVWITTKPEAASQILPEYINMVTEVRGFTDMKIDEYFRKRFRNKELASSIISHVKASQSLHIMCRIPVLCWITATVLEDMFKTNERREQPKTLTEMYIHFLLVQIKLANVKYYGKAETDPTCIKGTSKTILSLGKLAFEQLQKGSLIFYEADLKECGIDVGAASEFPRIIKENAAFNQDKLFSFIHLSVQEFLAAFHVIVSFIKSGVNPLSQEQSQPSSVDKDQSAVKGLFQSAVDHALQNPNGHLDLFLCFLVGLSLHTHQALLQNLTRQLGSSLESNQDTVQYIRKRIREKPSPERCISLFCCLNELKDHSLLEEIQQSLRTGRLSSEKLSSAQWSTLVFIILSSETELNMFDLKKFSASEESLLNLLPLVQASRLSLLDHCQVSSRGCRALALVLSSPSSNLRALDLSYNQYDGVYDLAVGLQDPQCRLETLRLSNCGLTDVSGRYLSHVLSYQFSSLRELDLSNNNLCDSGVYFLSMGLERPHCKLETLRLVRCGLTWEVCDSVAFFLSSQSSCVRHLDLSMNNLQDSGVLVLRGGLESPHGKLEALRLRFCNLSEKSCGVLASVLTSQTSTSSLRQLELCNNDLQDSGVKLLTVALESPRCNLEILRLSNCMVSERSCEALASALSSKTSSLKELDLSSNDLQDSGVKLLSVGLKSPRCILETLRLSGCQVTEEGCSSLASALSSNPSYLKELDLSYNHPGDSGVLLFSAGLEDPQWRLDTLKVDHGGVQRLRPGLWKYACELTLDPNTAHRELSLSDGNRKVTRVEKEPYPYHPERFDKVTQLLCTTGLMGRCYWEVQAKHTDISVTYKGISRRGDNNDCTFGRNDKSWSLRWSNCPRVEHNCKDTYLSNPQGDPDRVGVFLDWHAGSVSFYSISSGTQTHLHTFHCTFTEPVYPGFGLFCDDSFVSLTSRGNAVISQASDAEI